eukprot:gnl/MRDRNA2_/MRDRNA2_122787_c0_seq1.p1 gnl/MRDRNA2_/MRDRNA2_122787_c0~~gnl/MRDRNA2_/MRDRNA2_122787_c0_seq1.p1  ORF type:complete len:614 (-),score=99.20 gnl/MRDRNA2_/MRDRNA2_122787_c0_seq1:25-1644(-)
MLQDSTRVRAGSLLQDGEDPGFLMTLVHRFKDFASENSNGVAARHESEAARLSAAIKQTTDPQVKLALEQSITSNEESKSEAEKVYSNIIKFSDSLEKVLGPAYEAGKSCGNVVCSEHASCTSTTLGPQCVCDEGYVGNGQNCHAPEAFMPQKLLHDGAAGRSPKVNDLHVSVFGGKKLVAAFRDESHGNSGVVMLGFLQGGDVSWSTPNRFTQQGKAFSPVVVGLPSNRIVVAYRDANREGTGWMRSAEVGVSGVRGADMHLSWGPGTMLGRNQAHGFALVPLPGNRVAAIFPDSTPATMTRPREPFGNSLLAVVGPKGSLSVVGKFRWTDAPVVRVEVTQLTPASFVVAARAGKAVDELDTSKITRQEAMVVYGELDDTDLVFDPNALNIEPAATQVWGRGVGLVAPNMFGYAYQLGKTQKTKLAIIHVDPETHRMKIADGPMELGEGFSPYVSMLSVPYSPADPHTLVYYQPKDKAMLNVCDVTSVGKLQHCEDFSWAAQPLGSVAGVTVQGGKSLFLFTTKEGVPYYQVVGLSKK